MTDEERKIVTYRTEIDNTALELRHALGLAAENIETEEDIYNSLSIIIGLLEIAKRGVFLSLERYEGEV